jgi:small-conductance mechanosensitive channel
METSIYLAKLIGPIYLVVGLGLLLNREHYSGLIQEFSASPALFYLSAIIALIFGGLIVLLHNVWTGWPVVITLIGWAAILKGTARSLLPTQTAAGLKHFAEKPNLILIGALVAMALGAFLTAMGYGLIA